MNDKELAPINVEIVPAEELDGIKVIAKADGGEGACVGIGERADAFLGLASDVIGAAEGKSLYKIEVPEGYSLKDLVASKKDPEAVRALVRDSKGHLSGDVSLKTTGVSPTQIAGVGLAAAAMVVGQAYMTEISDSLQRIDAKMDTVVSMIAGEQRAKVKNALDIAKAYANLYDDYLQKPPEARQAARNEIEGRYNDIGQVIDWVTEQLSDVEGRVKDAASREKDLKPLLEELRSYEDQFGMCLQALSALAMTRMYYDGGMDDRSALVEQQRIIDKSQGFLEKRQTVAALMEMKIGALKGAPVSLPRGPEKNPLKRLASQTPRAAAKEQLLEAKVEMRSKLRSAESKVRSEADDCRGEIARIAATTHSARTMLTDGTSCWFIDDQEENEG